MWRLATFSRTIATVIAVVPALMALVLWVQAALHRSVDGALEALTLTGVAAAYGVAIWWFALRPRVLLTADEVVAVNPWGTQRVAVADVVAVTGGMWGGRLVLRDGWSVTVFVLSGMYGGRPDRAQARRGHDLDAERDAGSGQEWDRAQHDQAAHPFWTVKGAPQCPGPPA